MTTHTPGDHTPAFAPIAVIGAIGFGIWSYFTKWDGISVTVLGQPTSISAGFVSLAAVTIAACVAMRAPWKSLVAVTGLFAGFGFLWLIAQAAPLATR